MCYPKNSIHYPTMLNRTHRRDLDALYPFLKGINVWIVHRIIKVGVGIFNLARRLEADHDLIVSGTVDLRALAEKVDLSDRM